MKKKIVIIYLLFVACGSLHAQNRVDTLLSKLYNASDDYVFVVAHRGDWRNEPENSLRAMARCIRMGADMVELDVRMTKDSVLVLMHDVTIDRTTTGKGRVADLTFEELQQYRLKDGLGVTLNQQIPTFKEVMLLCKDKILVNVDKAETYMDLVYEVLKETGTERQVVFKSYHTYQEVRERYGELLDNIIYMPMIRDNHRALDAFVDDFINHYKPVAFEVNFRTVESPMFAQMQKMKEAGIKIWINTLWSHMNAGHDDEKAVDDPDKYWGWVVAQGANIIQTDRPIELLDYLKSINKRKL